MKCALKRNALLAAALAIFFWCAFQFAKHDQVLRKIVPFGEDPFDSVSSFGVITVAILALVSLLRSIVPKAMSYQPIYASRTVATASFCILVTVSAEAVAMARHYSMWAGMPGSRRLLLLQGSLAVFAVGVLLATRPKQVRSAGWYGIAATVSAVSLIILAVYPEQLIASTSGHLLTVLLGAVLLFAPVSALVKAWIPEPPSSTTLNPSHGKCLRQGLTWALGALIGCMVGISAYFAEVSEGPRPPFGRIFFVGGIFAGLGTYGVLIGLVFLGRLLGLRITFTHVIERVDKRDQK